MKISRKLLFYNVFCISAVIAVVLFLLWMFATFVVFRVDEVTQYSDKLRTEMEEHWKTTIPSTVKWKDFSRTQYQDIQFAGYFVAREEDFQTMFPSERFSKTSITITAEETRDIVCVMAKLFPEMTTWNGCPEAIARMNLEDGKEYRAFMLQAMEQYLQSYGRFLEKAFPWIRTGSDTDHTMSLIFKEDEPFQQFKIVMEHDALKNQKCTFYVFWSTH